jgi:hypothetical protein
MVSTTSHNSGWTELWSSNKTNVSEWTKATVDLSEYVGKKFFISFVNIAGFGFCSGVDEVAISGDSGNVESRIEWSEDIHKKTDVSIKENTFNDKRFAYQSGSELIVNGEGHLQIIDLMGRVIYSDDMENYNNRVDMTSFNKGAYIIRLINKESVKTQKITVY